MPLPLRPRNLRPPRPTSLKKASSVRLHQPTGWRNRRRNALALRSVAPAPPRQPPRKTKRWMHVLALRRVAPNASRPPPSRMMRRRHAPVGRVVASELPRQPLSRPRRWRYAQALMLMASAASRPSPRTPGHLGLHLASMRRPSLWSRTACSGWLHPRRGLSPVRLVGSTQGGTRWALPGKTWPTVRDVLALRLRREPPAARGSTHWFPLNPPRGVSQRGRDASWTPGLRWGAGPYASGGPWPIPQALLLHERRQPFMLAVVHEALRGRLKRRACADGPRTHPSVPCRRAGCIRELLAERG